jgi:hypothetical protein
MWMQCESQSEREEEGLSGCVVVPLFFLLGTEALAFVPLADMAEVEGKEGCVKGLEAV